MSQQAWTRCSACFCSFNLFKKITYFLAVLGLHCCTQAFSSCRERGLLSSCGAWASHRGGFSCCGAQALDTQASVVAAQGLISCGVPALERGLSSRGAWA